MLLDHLQDKLATIEAQSQTRVLRLAESATAPRQRVRSAGVARELLMFCSNDYLGLAAHPRLGEALVEGVRRYGAGAGASPLVSGHSLAHEQLEQRLAGWYDGAHIPNAKALSFCTGYMANLAVVSTLGDADAQIFSADLNHASLIDGARLARAQVSRYPHADMAALRALLAASTARIKLIVTDAVFSMDGNIAALPDILALAEQFDAWVIVDDAHGFGVLGARGRGALEHFGLCSERLILVGTLGKAAGLAGAFVVAHELIAQYLLQAARSYIFTTAAPPAIAHALLSSLDLIEGEEGQRRRQQLAQLRLQLRSGVAALLARHMSLGWRQTESQTPVQPLIVGDNALTMALAQRLERQGLRVPGIRPPTVPPGTARLRICLCATHQPSDVDQLLAALEAATRGGGAA